MNRKQIDRLKRKINILLQLAFENGIDYSKTIAKQDNAPSIQDLQFGLYPEWELEIDEAIKFLEFSAVKLTNLNQDPLVKIEHPEGRTGKTSEERNKAIDILGYKNKYCNT